MLDKVGAGAYRLKLPPRWKKIHPVFNEILLKPAIKPIFESQRIQPLSLPKIIDNKEHYEIEKIRDLRVHRQKLQYLVKWVGYAEPTWQPETDFDEHAAEAI